MNLPLRKITSKLQKKEPPIHFLLAAVRGAATSDLVFDIPFAQH
jgi:hypothetical protein